MAMKRQVEDTSTDLLNEFKNKVEEFGSFWHVMRVTTQ
jgi:hypothetical protein